ncbi:MAG: hypothetical protein ACOYIQ_04330 [Christensenellales bacterium]|jgi:hypothetical protein
MFCYYVIGIRVDNRLGNALKIQETLTQNGCMIKTRLGLHEVSETACSNDGLILLQPCGSKEEIERLVTDLNGIDGVRAKLIDLN